MKYDVIIPVAFKDYAFFKKTYTYLCDNLGAEHIFILTNGELSRFLPSVVRNNPKFVIIDENRLLDGLTYKRIHSIIKSQGREHTNTGWFFQQFLKMGFAFSEYCRNEYYMSWDADTIPVRKISFFDDSGRPYFTMKSEYHKPYFDTMEKLIGLGKTNPSSYIAEHMMFNRDVMRELTAKMETAVELDGDTWYEKVMSAIPPETVSTNSFSEFETYGTFCAKYHPGMYVERSMNGFRLGGLIQGRFVSGRILREFAGYDYSVVSFEIYHRPPFPWGKICEWYERKYLKYKERILRKMAGA